MAPIVSNDLNLDRVVRSWAQRGPAYSQFIEGDFSHGSSCNEVVTCMLPEK